MHIVNIREQRPVTASLRGLKESLAKLMRMLPQQPRSSNDRIVYSDDGYVKQRPTRYSGQNWDKTASHLFCGVADSIEDVGLVFIGQPWDASEKLVRAADEHRWASLVAKERRNKSVWHLSPERGWLFVTWNREAVEDVMTWTMPYLRDDRVTEGARAIAFPGYGAFRNAFDSGDWEERDTDLWAFIQGRCLDRALFEMTWTWGSWTLYPASIQLDRLLKLADPVVTRINTELTDLLVSI
jgi:hypothetical protein